MPRKVTKEETIPPCRMAGRVKTTINLGNYESIHLEFEAEVMVPEGKKGEARASLIRELDEGMAALLKGWVGPGVHMPDPRSQFRKHFDMEDR